MEEKLQNNADRYLIFRIGKERMGAPLLSIREIVEPLPFRKVPNKHDYYLGLANLRGQIVGVIDLAMRLGFEPIHNSSEGALLVFDVGSGSIAAYVSQVENVTSFEENIITKEGKIDTMIPSKAILGIAKTPKELLPLIELSNLIET
jgi:purine-binding chemotaxis protein CheW